MRAKLNTLAGGRGRCFSFAPYQFLVDLYSQASLFALGIQVLELSPENIFPEPQPPVALGRPLCPTFPRCIFWILAAEIQKWGMLGW